MPVDLNLYQGGSGPTGASQAALGGMFQSTNPAANPVQGYADHQRRRSYQVTRQMAYGPLTPAGGVDIPVKLNDWLWYQDYLAAGNADIGVGDHLNIILLPKNTRLEYVYAWVLAPTTVAGLTFDLVQ